MRRSPLLSTNPCQDRYQHKLESRSRNTSVLWQAVTRKCQDRYQHKLEYRSRNTSVLWQTVTATPFGTYNIIKSHTSTGRPTNSSITSQTTLYWGTACLTGNGFQTTPRTICDNICGQSCEKQIATQTHARLIQTGINFGCEEFFAGLAANFVADGAGSRLESVSR